MGASHSSSRLRSRSWLLESTRDLFETVARAAFILVAGAELNAILDEQLESETVSGGCREANTLAMHQQHRVADSARPARDT